MSDAVFIPDLPPAMPGDRVVIVGKQLASACEGILNSLRPATRTSTDLAKAVGVNKDIASRFLIAAGKRDPLAVVYYMPGVESLRRLSRGAMGRTSNPRTVELFDEAIDAYESFLQHELGGRHALDAMASAWLPEARERFEGASRQMAFRAAANLRGIESQVIISSSVLHPGDDEQRYDSLQLEAVIGVQRLRPGVPLMITTFDSRDDTAGRPTETIDGQPIRADGDAREFLPQFGRGPPPALDIIHADQSSYYHLVDERLGAGTANDLYFGHWTAGMFRRWARFPGDIAARMEALEVPTQRLVMDLLLHPDVWPGTEPELMHYGTYVRGVALPYNRGRDIDRLHMLDSVRFIGNGIECCRVSEAPRYIEALEQGCRYRGWDPTKLRVYRCDSKYPVYGVQYTLGFRLKEKPSV